MSTVQKAVETALEQPFKLDIGCGRNKKEGFYGVDIFDFEGVDIVADLREKHWLATKVPEPLYPRFHISENVSVPNPANTDVMLGTAFTLPDNSVDEVHCSHFIEHLTNLGDRWERVNFFNELYRVMKPGAVCSLILPHWCSNRYYGDPTHKEPFSEMGFYYLERSWRLGGTQKHPIGNAPHADSSVNPNGYSCDFDSTWGYNLHPGLANRHQDYVMHAMTFWKDACTDMVATLTKPLTPR